MKCYYLMEELVFNLRGFSLGLKKPQKLAHVHAYMYKLVSHIIAVRERFWICETYVVSLFSEGCNIHVMLICSFFILTDISGFELNTEQRSHKRENFEMHKKAREAEIEAAKRQRERQKEEEEKAYVAKVRAEAVHKSQPIKRFKSVEVLPSDRPLTFAESPKFETDRRLRSKVNCF